MNLKVKQSDVLIVWIRVDSACICYMNLINNVTFNFYCIYLSDIRYGKYVMCVLYIIAYTSLFLFSICIVRSCTGFTISKKMAAVTSVGDGGERTPMNKASS